MNNKKCVLEYRIKEMKKPNSDSIYYRCQYRDVITGLWHNSFASGDKLKVLEFIQKKLVISEVQEPLFPIK